MAYIAEISSPRAAGTSDFVALLKPRVMSLVVFTGLVGLAVAPGHIHPLTALTALICIAAGAGASGALNMGYDADIDRLMARTAARPIPRGQIGREDALYFGWTLAIFSVVIMGLMVNFLAAGLLAFTIFFYVVVYTLLLKRRTVQNIVVGGLAGALPPAIGWAAVTGTLSLAPITLVLLIFFWTPPHFWALALWRSHDYARAGVPMMPVVKGKAHTRKQIFAYSLALFVVGFAPVFVGLAGLLYVATAWLFGLLLIGQAFAVLRERDDVKEPAAKQLFVTTIVYLFVMFAVLLLEHVFAIAPLAGMR